MSLEKIESIFYKGINPSDFAAIYKTRKPEGGNGQTYINIGSVKGNEEEFLDFFSYAEQSINAKGNLSFKLHGYVLGEEGGESTDLIISHRTGKRSDYMILNQQNPATRHPAFSKENGFPEPKKDKNKFLDDPNGFLGIIDYLTILIIKTSFHKYYVTFIDEIKNNWPDIDVINSLFDKMQANRGEDNRKKDLAGILNFDAYDCSFKNDKNNPFSSIEKKSVKQGAKNLIYYGAPGTGKSFGIEQFVRNHGISNYKTNLGNDLVHRVTLYPEYSYSDFVGQVMPVVEDNFDNDSKTISYEFVPGDFTVVLKKALHNPDEFVFLIMEEMSRSNISSVFGDLFQLLDRDNTGRSEYTINNSLIADYIFDGDSDMSIYIPSNLMIVGTVNTSDQNVYVMDTAFKRRFEWEYVSTIPQDDFDNNPEISIIDQNGNEQQILWEDFFETLNDYIVNELELNEDKQIGPYFVKFSIDDKISAEKRLNHNNNLIKNKLLQYLWEDVASVSNMTSENKLFSENISSFSALYSKYENKKIIFSNSFLKALQSKVLKDVSGNNEKA